MQGQKQILTFIVILFVILTFTFFRNSIRRDKQFRRIREEALRKKLESWEHNEQELEPIKDLTNILDNKNYLYKLLEYKDICYDLHAIIFKPEKEKEQIQQYQHSKLNRHQVELEESCGKYDKNTNNNKKNDEYRHETAGQILETRQKNSVVTGPVIYIFIVVLIYSFVKAAMDFSRQLSKKKDDDSSNRKCSLQEYAGSKRSYRRPSRGPVLRRATTLTAEPRLGIKQQSLEERRTIYLLSEFNHGIGLITEPGTPPKIINGLASRPPPLLRRCSVPAFALQTGPGSILRRPSVDSYSEDDSSPDVKRRVRMIHRH